jgi:hypothetical protein
MRVYGGHSESVYSTVIFLLRLDYYYRTIYTLGTCTSSITAMTVHCSTLGPNTRARNICNLDVTIKN